ncbi:hypothetical protein E3U43_007479, partial [Larimichthys crocea]
NLKTGRIVSCHVSFMVSGDLFMAPYDVIIHTLCVSAEAIWKWTGDPFPIPRGCVIGGLCAVVIWKLVQNKKSSPCSSSKESDNVDLEDKKLKLTDKLENVAHKLPLSGTRR